MARTSSTIHVDAPLDRVMDVIRDLENYPNWTSGISAVEILETDSSKQPTLARFKISGGPISDLVELEYAWHSDSVEWHLKKGSTVTELNGSYKVVADETGCQVTYELVADVSISLPSFIKTAAEKTIVTSALQGLKDYVK